MARRGALLSDGSKSYDSALLRRPLLYLSLFLKQHREEYYRRLDLVRAEGDWESWLEFFLQGVAVTALQAVETSRRLTALFEADFARVNGLGRASGRASQVLRAVRERPVGNIRDIAARCEVSYPTAGRAVAALERMGILAEITGRLRERVFAYRAYLEILNEGAEPL